MHFNSNLLNRGDMWFLCESVQDCLSPFLWPFLILSPSPWILTRDLFNWDTTPLPLTAPLILAHLLTSPYSLTLNPSCLCCMRIWLRSIPRLFFFLFCNNSWIDMLWSFITQSGLILPTVQEGQGPVGHLNKVTSDVRTQGLMLGSLSSFHHAILLQNSSNEKRASYGPFHLIFTILSSRLNLPSYAI